jgi:uncharacterized protein YbjT (DUF2867 family)
MAFAKPVVCVMGATGAQGGAVINSLLADDRFALRATSRNPDSASSQKLKGRGVEVVKADTANKASLVNAFKNCYAVFGLTQFWDPSVGEKEFEHGKNVVDAAKEANVQWFIFSSLPNSKKVSGGKLEVAHFTLKAEIEAYARHAGLPHVIFVEPGCYMQNFQSMMKPRKNADGSVTFSMALKPNTPLYMIDINDMGPAVAAILRDPKKWDGRTIPLCGSALTLDKIVSMFTESTGIKAKAEYVPEAQLTMQNKEMGEMFQWFNDYGYFGPGADLDTCNQLCKMTSFNDWAKKTNWKEFESAK